MMLLLLKIIVKEYLGNIMVYIQEHQKKHYVHLYHFMEIKQ